MCVIVVKKKDIAFPSMKELENCFDYNSDGAGLMYTDKGEVVIEKGFMTWKDFEKRVNELKEKYNDFEGKSFVAHFRIGTQGANDAHTCHPFPISSKHKMLRKTNLRTDVGMVHNGIISEYGRTSKYSSLHEKDKLLSDTQLFIRYTVNAFKSLNRKFYKNPEVMECLAHITTGSKLCFLDKEDNLYLTGDYVTSDEGVIYSNNSYKSYTTRYYTPSTKTYSSWDDYYEDEWGWSMSSHYDERKYEDKPITSQTYAIEEDDTLYDYVGQYHRMKLKDCISKLITLDKGDSFYFQDGYLMHVQSKDTYYYDDFESILYSYDDELDCLLQLDFGWVEEGV